MTIKKSIGVTLLSCGATTLWAEEFTPNHLFATSQSTDAIYELDVTGAHVRTILALPLGCPNPSGLAFSPRGTLFVASLTSPTIVEIDASGAKLQEFTVTESAGGMRSIEFGPDGDLYIGGASFQGYEVRTPDGVFVFSSESNEAPHAGSLAIGADGAVWTVKDGDETVARWGVPNFAPDLFWISPFSDNSSGHLTFDGRGRLHVTFAEGIHVYNGSMTKLDEYAQGFEFSTKRGLSIGPNGNSFLGSYELAEPTIFEFDRDSGEIVRKVGQGQAAGGDYDRLAFAPFRFSVEVAGPGVFELGASSLDEKGASLTLFPGSGRAFLQFDDSTLDSQDFSSLFGTTTLVFQGFEQEKSNKKLRYGATQVPVGVNTRGLASISLEVKGKTSAQTGFFAVTSAEGTLHRAGSAGVLSATVRTKKLLK